MEEAIEVEVRDPSEAAVAVLLLAKRSFVVLF
jgi:hypothetical protein